MSQVVCMYVCVYVCTKYVYMTFILMFEHDLMRYARQLG